MKPMIYSTASEYALRALTHLAQQQARPRPFTTLREIAEAEDIPYPFLAKISQGLVRAGLLSSAKGRKGGYALGRPPREITLHDIKEVVDGTDDLQRCASGLDRCDDEMPCPLHDAWKPIREQIRTYMKTTTLEDMVEALARKRTLVTGETANMGIGAPTPN